MAIEFVCPTCGGTLQVGDEAAGRVIRCGGCQSTLRVPGEAPASSPQAPASPFESAPPERRSRRPDPPGEEPREPRRRRDRDDDDPYQDRPRRARREMPPPSAGRGVFFWLVIVSLLAFFSLVACCGGFFLLAPGAKWHWHQSERGGFRVELPGPMQRNVEKQAGLLIDTEAKSEGAVLTRKVKVFAVLYREVKATKARPETTDEELIDRAVQDIQRAVQAQRPTADNMISVGGFPAREVEFQSESKGWFAARIIAADTRLYILVAGGGFARPGDADALRFLTSFEITDGKLVNEGKRRAAKKDDRKNGKDKEGKQKEKEPEPEPEKPKEPEKKPGKPLPVAPQPRTVDE